MKQLIGRFLISIHKLRARHNVAVLGRPEVDIKEFVDKEKLSFTVEVNVRPDVVLPDFSSITITVDDADVKRCRY